MKTIVTYAAVAVAAIALTACTTKTAKAESDYLQEMFYADTSGDNVNQLETLGKLQNKSRGSANFSMSFSGTAKNEAGMVYKGKGQNANNGGAKATNQ